MGRNVLGEDDIAVERTLNEPHRKGGFKSDSKSNLLDVSCGVQDAQQKNPVSCRAEVEAVFAKRVAAAALGEFRPGATQAVMARQVVELE